MAFSLEKTKTYVHQKTFNSLYINKKQPRATGLLAGNNGFQRYDLEYKYAVCSGTVYAMIRTQ